ncbi:MAG: hypothetical protein FJ148_13490 [Deltaproteobacteria bacterium]|nr:hypothetical protein [Deltaproteobacteria bacterium]
MIDRALLEQLEASAVRFCVIGGIALAAHGHARYTADVDLLTMDRRVLDDALWKGAGRAVEIRVGDADDPLGGVVRWPSMPPHDLLVGRGYAMQLAVDTAVREDVLGAPVATAVALVLLKLEAGAPHDRNDIVALAEAQKALGTYDWRGAIAAHLPRLSAAARATWDRVAADLPH